MNVPSSISPIELGGEAKRHYFRDDREARLALLIRVHVNEP